MLIKVKIVGIKFLKGIFFVCKKKKSIKVKKKFVFLNYFNISELEWFWIITLKTKDCRLFILFSISDLNYVVKIKNKILKYIFFNKRLE